MRLAEKEPIVITKGSAKELGACNRCSARGEVYEISLGDGRLCFRLCGDCADDFWPLLRFLRGGK